MSKELYNNLQKGDIFFISNNEKMEFIEEEKNVHIINNEAKFNTFYATIENGLVFKNEKGDNYIYTDSFVPIGHEMRPLISGSLGIYSKSYIWTSLSENEKEAYTIIGKIPNLKDKLNILYYDTTRISQNIERK